jgi:hypothetical protein
MNRSLLLMLITALLVACGRDESAIPAGSRTPVGVERPSSLDQLIVSLDTAGGFFNIEDRNPGLISASIDDKAFAAAGKSVLPRLIDCLTDTARTTTTILAGESDEPVRRGTICYQLLHAWVRVDSMPATVRDEDLYQRAPVQGEDLRKAQKAWREVARTGAYHWVLGRL